MVKFLTKLLIFHLPIFAGAVLLTYILLVSGELTSPEKLMQYHQDPNCLIGLAYHDPVRWLKIEAVKEKSPDILALGTSRVLQIRSFFFNKDARFYNAGRGISRIKDIPWFMLQIKKNKPQIIILGLDQYFFNRNWDDLSQVPQKRASNIHLSTFFQMYRSFLKDLVKGKIKIQNLSTDNFVGFMAKIRHQGFRSDGSYYYGDLTKHPELNEDWQFKDTFDRIKKKKRRFELGKRVNPEAVQVLESFLAESKRKNIHVIGFLPPFAHAVWEKLLLEKEAFAYMFSIFNTIVPIFAKYGFECHDYSDLLTVGANDSESIDGFHGSEVAYLRIIIDMGMKSPKLKPFINLQTMKNLLKKAYSPSELFKDPLLSL